MKKLKFALVSIVLSLLLCACKADIIPLSEAAQMNSSELADSLSGVSLDDIQNAWGDSFLCSSAENSQLYSASDDNVIAVFVSGDGSVSGVSRYYWCYGRYLRDKNGGDMVLIEQNGYIGAASVSGADGVSFDELGDGDRIRILVEGIAETYPCQALAYRAELMEKGSYDDLDKEQMDRLREMGWVE